MEIFNVKRRDLFDFDTYMDLKKPGFGGPASAIPLKDRKGNKIDKNPKLGQYLHTIERHELFASPHYDSTYKAVTNDIVYKQEDKKPTTYADPYHTAIPVKIMEKMNESKIYTSFNDFVNEQLSQSSDETIRVRNADLAEDILFDKKIDWDGFGAAPTGIRGKSFTKDGEIVAYYDEDNKDLIITSGAAQMSDAEHNSLYNVSSDEGESEDETEYDEPITAGPSDSEEDSTEAAFALDNDLDVNTDEDDEDTSGSYETSLNDADIAEIEKTLDSFENTEEDDDDDLDFPAPTEE